ncbi:MAG TPA: GNAT family N-acetyltransferase [Thermoanaerobaculia bacterium]|nr:GNAT family N-acetyltransferase [Thermoanaerobaculia bacterium]
MPKPRVAVFGNGDFGVAAARTVMSRGACLSAVVVPGNRSGPEVARFTEFAAVEGVPLLVHSRALETVFVQSLRALTPDVILVWSYPIILRPEILAVPRICAVNMHGGLLPEFRGAHVLQWAFVVGAPETGVTMHYMDPGVDTGPVIADTRFPIEDEDDAETVRRKMERAGSALLGQWWPRLLDGSAPRVPQDESRAKYWPMRRPEDGRIRWTEGSVQICRLVRALRCNTPGAFTEAGKHLVSIKRARPVVPSTAPGEPGRIVGCDDGTVRVVAGDGDVLVLEATIDEARVDVAALTELGSFASRAIRPVLSNRDITVHEGEKVRLRAFGPGDAERYRAWINDPETAGLVDHAGAVTKSEHEAWYRALVASPTSATFAIDRLDTGEFIGLVWIYDIHARHRRGEVRIVIGDKSTWGGGYGSDALNVLIRVAFGSLGLEKLWADVLTTNQRAARAFERSGFTREGLLRADRAVDGRRVDVIRLGLLRSDGRPSRESSGSGES